ncbi:MAG: AI-2E family transporter [bacterium]
MFKNKFFRLCFSIILVLIILYLFKEVNYIIDPLRSVFSFLIIPVLVSVFLYYLLRPMVSFLTEKIKYKNLAIIISFISVISLMVVISFFGGSIIQRQVKDLTGSFTKNYSSISRSINNAIEGNRRLEKYFNDLNIEERITNFVSTVFESIQNNFFGFFSTITNIGTILILIPLVLYYFLKDDRKIHNYFLSLIPSDKKKKVKNLLKSIDNTLSTYIGGQLIIAVILGVLTYIGYLIIDLPNALILSIITMITSFIPFIGPIMGIIPAIFIGLSTDLFLVVKIFIVLIVVQQLEGNFIQPKIQGNRLQIHPLIVIFVVLAFIMLFGFLGALFAVPTYTVLRVIIGDLYKDKVLHE